MAATPTLKRFEIFVTKNKNANDPSQVPTAAQVDFYRQGATVSADADVPAGIETDVSVYLRGALQEGDTVQIDTTPSPTFDVGAHPSDPKKVTLIYNAPSGIFPLKAGSRLVPTNSRPYVYGDASGRSPTGDTFLAIPSSGRGGCYIAAFRYDYIVSFGSTKRLHVDADGSFELIT